ncbi:MAG: transposase [Phycisphaerales bacterium]
MQCLHPSRTTWHITFGTYGTRLHGDSRPTVDRQHNERGTPFLSADPSRRNDKHARMKFPPVYLMREQCQHIQQVIPTICERGGWVLRICSAAPDHVHVLLDIAPNIHGEKVRRLLKRWLTQSLNETWPLPSDEATWWAEEGSNKPVDNEAYLNNAFNYIEEQRMS